MRVATEVRALFRGQSGVASEVRALLKDQSGVGWREVIGRDGPLAPACRLHSCPGLLLLAGLPTGCANLDAQQEDLPLVLLPLHAPAADAL